MFVVLHPVILVIMIFNDYFIPATKRRTSSIILSLLLQMESALIVVDPFPDDIPTNGFNLGLMLREDYDNYLGTQASPSMEMEFILSQM